jgi:indolepyruvate ferredoxin oxidoreductase
MIAEIEKHKAPGKSGLAEAAARGYYKLLAYKDEYEVARLFTQPEFEARLKEQFEGDFKLHFHLAPPLLARKDKHTGEPRKMEFGSWMLPVFRLLARFKHLRGTKLDVFGYTAERKMERRLIGEYEAVLNEIEQKLTPQNHRVAVELAGLPERMRGFGHVKLKNVETTKRREAELLRQLRAPDQGPAPVRMAAE